MMLHSISTAMKNLVLTHQKEDCTESQQKQQQPSSPSAGSSKSASKQQEEVEISSHSQMLGGMPLPIRQTGEKKAVCSMEECVVIPQSAVLGMAASQEAALAQAQSLLDPQKTESLQSMPALGQDETEESPKEQVILGKSEQLLQLTTAVQTTPQPQHKDGLREIRAIIIAALPCPPMPIMVCRELEGECR
jgi:hypothetical protein